MVPRQAGREANDPIGVEDEIAPPPSRAAPATRLSWPARDESPGNPQHRQTPPERNASDAARDSEFSTPPQGRSANPRFDPRPMSDSAPTQLYRPGRTSDANDRRNEARPGMEVERPAPHAAAAQDAANDPVVGWLVIVEGPGKGRSLELGMGANSIGRNSTQKIALDFGDSEIHRERHAQLVFDPRSKRFFLQGSADARNLTYLGNDLVLMPTELKGGETIMVGQTQLRFIALCGPGFSWS